MPSKKFLFYLGIFILLAIAVLPKHDQLLAGIDIAKTADQSWIILAVMSLIGTYFAAAFIYTILAKKPINYFVTLAVELASSFANRLLPSGIGGLGLNADYLMKNRHKPAEAGSVVAMSSTVAFVSHISLLIIALIAANDSFGNILFIKRVPWWLALVIIAVILTVLIIFNGHKVLKHKIIKLLKDTWKNFLNYRKKPFSLFTGVMLATLVTAFYVMAFFACTNAVGLPITVVQAFLIYTLGTLLGAAIMTPGGLGGVEAGLVAGLLTVKDDYGLAFSAVLIYRLITFWLPIVPGYLSFWLLQRNKKI